MIIWSFNYLVALEATCHLCKGSDFIKHFMTRMLKHINATMQVFTRVTGLICNCLVIHTSTYVVIVLVMHFGQLFSSKAYLKACFKAPKFGCHIHPCYYVANIPDD